MDDHLGRSAGQRIRLVLALLGVGLFLLTSGCVQRRMTIRSNPPGARVYVDDYEIGVTPVSTNFTYYGTRRIRLVKEGFETLTVLQPIPAPWHQYPPIDFVTENFIPGEFRIRHDFNYQLQPQIVVPIEHLLGRADQLRRSQPAVPPGALPPPSGAPAPGAALPGATPGAPIPGPAPNAGPELVPTPGPQPIAPGAAPIGGQPTYPLPPR